MTRSAKKSRLWFVILTLLTFVGWAPTDCVKHATSHRGGAVRLAAAGETWWCQGSGINEKLEDCFEESMQVDGVPLLKDYDTYQASLPVREVVYSHCISCPSMLRLRSPTWTVLLKGWALNWLNWECAPLLTLSQRLPILVSRHRCWWVSCVPES